MGARNGQMLNLNSALDGEKLNKFHHWLYQLRRVPIFIYFLKAPSTVYIKDGFRLSPKRYKMHGMETT